MTRFPGTLLTQGRRTVAAALRSTGNGMAGNWSSFRSVARWSPLAVSRQLLLLIVETFVPAGTCVDLVIDETLERRWGGKSSLRGHYRESALSSRKQSVSRWIVMAVVVTLPWTLAVMGLAFLVRAGYDPRGKRAARQAAQNGGHVGLSDDQPGAPIFRCNCPAMKPPLDWRQRVPKMSFL
jgi:hypothetical protein